MLHITRNTVLVKYQKKVKQKPKQEELTKNFWKLLPGPQTMAAESEADELFFGGSAGGGKALAIDTPIPTPDGWVAMGDLKVGDRVFDEIGLPCNVVAATDVMVDRPCYKVTFSDGAEIVCDAEHQWMIGTADWFVLDGKAISTKRLAFSLKNRCEVFNCGTGADGRNGRFVEAEPIASVPVRCIQVDSPRSLFLCGKEMIPTHNSALLLILATTQHRRSIIFRRTYPRLKAMIEKSRKILSGVARYNSTDKLWRGIPGDRVLEFGSIEREDDKIAWQGVDHDAKFWDELPEFSQEQYTFANAWNRSDVPGQRSRVIATGNPPTNQKGRWVLDYWAPWLKKDYPNPALPGELRWFITNENGEQEEVPSGSPVTRGDETYTPRSRTFIPASLDDNPYLAQTNYRSVLQSLPEPLRSLLLKGRFDMDAHVDDPWQVIPTAWAKDAMARWKDPANMPQDCLGVDVARGGKNQTIIAPRHGRTIDKLKVFAGTDTPDGLMVAAQVKSAMQNNLVAIHIDAVGVGSSPYDFLKIDRLKVVPLNGGKKALNSRGKPITDRTGTMTFDNLNACWLWNLRELLDPANPFPIALPDDDELLADLTSRLWTPIAIRIEGEICTIIQLESKKDIKTPLESGSPDRGDAVAYAFAEMEDKKGRADWLKKM